MNASLSLFSKLGLLFFIIFIVVVISVLSDTTSIIGTFDPEAPIGVSFSSPYPSGGSWVLPSDHDMNITVSNTNGSSMDVSFYWATNDTLIGTDLAVANNSVANVTVSFSYNRYQSYSWYVTVWANQSMNYSFTGEAFDWDIDRDMVVNQSDLDLLFDEYLNTSSSRTDITNDGVINYLDRSRLQHHWGDDYS